MKKGLPKPCSPFKKWWLPVMLTWVLSIPAAAHGNLQLLDKKITFSVTDVSLETALHRLQAVSGVKIFFSIEHIERSSPQTITLSVKDESLRKVLSALLGPRNIRYRVDEKNVAIIILKPDSSQGNETPGTSPPASSSPAAHSRAFVTGNVVDASTRQSMPGVNVLVKGTTNGTTTNEAGNYTLEVEASGIETIIFSFIGYTTFETPVNNRSVIDVLLQPEVKGLNEVVVNAGYYNVSDRERTGNISRVGAADIQQQPVSNPLATLQARVPGLEITQQTGVPGGNFKVRIRGTNSIANGNDPLYIIDGVPYMSAAMSFSETAGGILGTAVSGQGYSPLNSINPADIESIEVLKDADATAIYGSRGSNGVILITTKKGQAGKTKVDVNLYTGAAKVANRVTLLNRTQYLQMRREAFANDNLTPVGTSARDLLVWDTTRTTNWQQKLIGGTAHTTDARLAISGGDTHTQFLIGGGYHRETAVFPGSNSDQRIAAMVSLNNVSPDKKLRTSVSVNYAVNDTDLIKQDLTGRALTLPAVAPALYTESGELSWTNWSQTYENPLAFLNRKYRATTTNFIANTVIGYKILPALEAKINLGYTSTRSEAVSMTPVSSLDPAIRPASLNQSAFSESDFKNWIVEPQLNWQPKIGKGRFDLLAGTSFLDQTTEGLAQSASGFTSEALMRNIAAAPTRSLGTNYYSKYRYHAVFGRINYTLNDRYIINLTARRDGSSRFGPGKQFANFGAVGLAWLFSEEGFIKNNLPFLSFGKVRSSYGITGNDQLGDYQYLDTYATSSGMYQGQVGLSPVRLSNPAFAWETNHKLEAGLELGFFNSRLLSAISFYRNRSSNQLVGYPLPPTTGFTSIQGNFPATVQNTGVELELMSKNISSETFTWTTSLNLTIPRNKLVAFPGLAASPAYAQTYVVGEPLSIRKLYKYTGVNTQSGIHTVEDVNADGNYNVEDRQTVGFTGRKFYGGLLNSMTVYGITVDAVVEVVKQEAYDFSVFYDVAPGGFGNQPVAVMHRWQNPGDQTSVQRFTTSVYQAEYSRRRSSDNTAIDASFIRLKNLSVSCALPAKWVGRVNVSQASIFLRGQNLLTFTRYKGLDPETLTNNLPPLRILAAGFTVTL